jgi:hypothetical protein
MVTKSGPKQVKKPAKLDVKRMESTAKRIIKRDVAWLKDMAKR